MPVKRNDRPWFEIKSSVSNPSVPGGFCRAEVKINVGLLPEDVYQLVELLHRTTTEFSERIAKRSIESKEADS